MNTWVEPLRAAAAYSKHGWPTVDSNKKSGQTEYNKSRSDQYAIEIERTIESLTDRMTLIELSAKLNVHKSTVFNRLEFLFKQKRIDRKKIGSVFVYWRV